MEEWIISKEDLKEYFENKRIIAREELIKYYHLPGDYKSNFNAIFNATPRKSYKKRRETR